MDGGHGHIILKFHLPHYLRNLLEEAHVGGFFQLPVVLT
jgi:hypothetical protein